MTNDLSLQVRQLTWESDGVLSAVLVDSAGAELPAWQPGAHVDVLVGEAGVRQYSLAGDSLDRSCYRIAVLREPAGRGGSAWIHEQLRCGAHVTVRGPRNHFQLDAAGEYVFLAGGIGITPILAMIRAVEPTGKPWRLLYGGRNARSMAFVSELSQYGEHVQLFDETVAGLIPLGAIEPGPDTLIYACGPEPLLSACEALAASWPAGCLRLERFAARPDVVEADELDFDVRLARTGRTVHIPAGQSILHVLRSQGLSTMSSCEEGLCGTCEVDVLEGEIDHRDEVLSPEERACGTQMMICVSRAKGTNLTLDL